MQLTYAWELGTNLGHLERGMAIGAALRRRGADCSFVVRDVRSSSKLLSRHRFAFHWSPQCAGRSLAPPRPSLSYSDILLATGFDNPEHLLAKVRAWIGLLDILRADAILIDHSPVALLASRICGVPSFLVGSGFDVPPQITPTPPLLENPSTTEVSRQQIDARVAASVNRVLSALARPTIERIVDLFTDLPHYLTTLPELDVYGPREGVRYVGPVSPVSIKPTVTWTDDNALRGFAYLRTDTPGFAHLMQALSCCGHQIVCVIPDGTAELLDRYSSEKMRILTHTIEIKDVLRGAHFVVCYGSAGLIAESLLAGVPILSVSDVPERIMNARRTEALGTGIALTRAASMEEFANALALILKENTYRESARRFAQKYAQHRPAAAEEIADGIVTQLQSTCSIHR